MQLPMFLLVSCVFCRFCIFSAYLYMTHVILYFCVYFYLPTVCVYFTLFTLSQCTILYIFYTKFQCTKAMHSMGTFRQLTRASLQRTLAPSKCTHRTYCSALIARFAAHSRHSSEQSTHCMSAVHTVRVEDCVLETLSIPGWFLSRIRVPEVQRDLVSVRWYHV